MATEYESMEPFTSAKTRYYNSNKETEPHNGANPHHHQHRQHHQHSRTISPLIPMELLSAKGMRRRVASMNNLDLRQRGGSPIHQFASDEDVTARRHPPRRLRGNTWVEVSSSPSMEYHHPSSDDGSASANSSGLDWDSSEAQAALEYDAEKLRKQVSCTIK